MRYPWLVLSALLLVALPAPAQFGLPPAANNTYYARQLLTAINPLERIDAARRLSRSRDERVIQVLAQAAVSDNDPRVRREATDAIARIRADTGTGIIPGPPVGGFPGYDPPIPPLGGDPYAELVQSWYQRYLRRSADWGALRNFTGQLRRGRTPEQVQGTILGSDEYFRLNGNTDSGYIRGLYRDILGRSPSYGETRGNLDRLRQLQMNRSAYAEQFLAAAQNELNQRPTPY